MVSEFENILQSGREEAREKLKIIAPNFKGEIKESGIPRTTTSSRRSSRGSSSSRSSRGSSSRRSSIQPTKIITDKEEVKAALEKAALDAREAEAAKEQKEFEEKRRGGALAEEQARQESVKLGERVTPIEPTGKPTQEAGALTLTQEEFEAAGEQAPKGRGVLVVGEDVSPADAVGIGADVDTIRSVSERGFIETGLEKFRVGLSEEEREQTTGQVILGRAAEVGGQIVAIGGSLVEGTINLGSKIFSQTLEFDESGQLQKPEGFRFSETGIVGRARAQPRGTGTLLGSALVFAPLVGAAVAGGISAVSQLGFKGALVETAGSFTPLKIQSGTFGALAGSADDLKFDVVSLKSQKGDLTQRLVVGRARDFDDVLLVSTQAGKDGVGIATTDIIAPRTTFRGGRFTEGISGGRVDTLFLGRAGTPSVVSPGAIRTTQTFDDIVGAGAGVVSRQRFGFSFDPRSGLDIALGGDVSRQIVGGVTARGEAFDVIGAGRGRPFLKIGREGITRSVRVQDFNVRGVELDVSKFGSGAPSSVGNIVTGGKSTGGLGTQEAIKQVSAAVTTPKTSVITPISTPSPAPALATVFGAPSVFAGTGQFERTDFVGVRAEVTSGSMMDNLLQQPKADVLPIVDTDALVDLDTRTKQRGRTKVISRARQEFDFATALDVGLAFQPALDTRQRLKQPQKQKQIQVTSPISPLGFGFGFIPQPFTTPFGFPGIPIPKVGIFETPGAVVTGDRGFIETPSLGAIIKEFEFGIKPQRTTRRQRETGLFERPFVRSDILAPLPTNPRRRRKSKKKRR